MKKKTLKKSISKLLKATYADEICTNWYKNDKGEWRAVFSYRRPRKALSGKEIKRLLYNDQIWRAFNNVTKIHGLPIENLYGFTECPCWINPTRKYFIEAFQYASVVEPDEIVRFNLRRAEDVRPYLKGFNRKIYIENDPEKYA